MELQGSSKYIQEIKMTKPKNMKTKEKNNAEGHETKIPHCRKDKNDFLNISTKKGKARIASLNMDNLRTPDSIRRLLDLLKTSRIDIACIQETHNDRIDSIQLGDYTIFFWRL